MGGDDRQAPGEETGHRFHFGGVSPGVRIGSVVVRCRFGVSRVEPEDGIGALVGFGPSGEPRFERRVHADDQAGLSEAARMAWADLKTVRLAVRWNDILYGNSFWRNDMNPVFDDRETRDHQGFGLGVSQAGRVDEPEEAENGVEAEHARAI